MSILTARVGQAGLLVLCLWLSGAAGCVSRPLSSGFDLTPPGLPKGGETLINPTNRNMVIYHTIRDVMRLYPHPAGEDGGLWISRDAGTSWEQIPAMRDIDRLIIHPDTGILYAILNETLMIRKDDGLLVPGGRSWLAMSTDGRKWKDITGGLSQGENFDAIFPDTDNPGRICVYRITPGRPHVLCSVDDKYSAWVSIDAAEYAARHPGWNQSTCGTAWMPGYRTRPISRSIAIEAGNNK